MNSLDIPKLLCFGSSGLQIFSAVLLPVYKLNRENTPPEIMRDIVFEKTKVRGRAVNRTSVHAEAASQRVH